MPTDTDLLSRFHHAKDERAFEELVHRQLGLVLGAARRRLPGRDALAEDVAQRVFVTLVRKSGLLQTHPCLPAWLQKCAAYEALRAARKELNHAKTMTKLRHELESGREGPPPDPRFEAAMAVLDEALAALGAGDRRTLMLRFYEGKSFKEIALLCGKSEAASQKQTRRAIDKLGGLLSRRGVAVPAAVLASGLTAELGQSASVALASSIADSALTHVPLAGTAGILTHLTLMKTKTAILVGSTVLIACATTGYVAGRVAQPDGSAASGTQASPPNAAKTLDSGSREPDRARPTGADRETLRALLDLARIELQKADHDVVSAARARARLAAIPFDQVPTALELIAAMPGGFEGETTLTDALLTHWAMHDGKAACDFSLANRIPGSRGIAPIRFPLTAWAEVDPAAALGWYQERAAEKHPVLQEENIGPRQYISNIRWVMTAWIHSDLDGAIAAYRALESEKQRTGARIAFSEYAGSVGDRIKLLDLFAEAPESGRDANLSNALSSWSRERPEELARWVDETTVEGVNPRTLLPSIFKNWATMDQEAAVKWWMTRESEQDRPKRLRDLMQAWGESEAARIAAALPNAHRVSILSAILARWALFEPEEAADFATNEVSPYELRNTLAAVYQSWAKGNPQAALAHYEKLAASGRYTPNMGLDSVLAHLFFSWGQEDTAAAAEAAQSLADKGGSYFAWIGLASLAETEEFREQAIETVLAIKEDAPRTKALGWVIGKWAGREPRAAATWLDENNFTDHKLQWAVAQRFARIDPEGNADWLLRRAAPNDREKALSMALNTWARSDIAAASTWLDKNGPTDGSIRIIAEVYASIDLEKGIAWAKRASDEKRDETIAGALAQARQFNLNLDMKPSLEAGSLSAEEMLKKVEEIGRTRSRF